MRSSPETCGSQKNLLRFFYMMVLCPSAFQPSHNGTKLDKAALARCWLCNSLWKQRGGERLHTTKTLLRLVRQIGKRSEEWLHALHSCIKSYRPCNIIFRNPHKTRIGERARKQGDAVLLDWLVLTRDIILCHLFDGKLVTQVTHYIQKYPFIFRCLTWNT